MSEKLKAILKETFETIIFVVVMVVLIRFFVCEIRWIPSGSMRPTLIEGDRIFVERFSRFYTTPKRGDIIVFYPPFEELDKSAMGVAKRLTGFFCKDVAYIKRVIGLPGDTVEVKANKSGKYSVLINGKALEESYIMDEYDYIPCTEQMFCGPMKVPAGNYFMMGDNRGNSQDSRFWGFLPQSGVIGRAVFLFWPPLRLRIF